MATPDVLVDADLALWSNDHYFVVTDEEIWRTTDLTSVGAATWEKVYDGTTFPDGDNLVFLRIKCAQITEGLVFALAYAESDTPDKYNCFCFRSSNYGMTWSWSLVREDAATGRDYKITTRSGYFYWASPTASVYAQLRHPRQDHAGDGGYNPWAFGYHWTGVNSKFGWGHNSISTSINNFNSSGGAAGSLWAGANQLLSGGDQTIAEGWLDDYFGSGNWANGIPFAGVANWMPKVSSRVNYRLGSDPSVSGNPMTLFLTQYGVWNKAWVDAPPAFDIAPLNQDWLYIGFQDKVYQSVDSGIEWEEWLNEGAYDLAVHTMLAGVIAYWNPTGSLKLAEAGVAVATLKTETHPAKIPYRVIYDPLNGVKMWAMVSDAPDRYDLQKREVGSWATQVANIQGARGLVAYVGGELLYMERDKIWYSSNYGGGWNDKSGGWTTIEDPIRAHLMRA